MTAQIPEENVMLNEAGDDTMEREVQSVNSEPKLPLNPIIAEEVLSSTPALVNEDNATAESQENSHVNASSSSTMLLNLPDLREREDGGAMNFEADDEPLLETTEVSDAIRAKSRQEFTTVYDIIDTMEATLADAKNVLFQPSMAKVDRDEFADHLTQLKDMLPVQLERASALMREAERRLRTAQAQANSIISSAQSQAAQLVEEAQERAQFLAGQENVTALAKKKAHIILSTAQAQSDKLTQGADQYCLKVMTGLKQQLDKLEQDVQAGVRVLEERRQDARNEQDTISTTVRRADFDHLDEAFNE